MSPCMCVRGEGKLSVHDIPSKRQAEVLVEQVSVHPLAHLSLAWNTLHYTSCLWSGLK